MNEQLMHFLWKFRKFGFNELYSTNGELIRVVSTGIHNGNAGPDFFNARIEIGGQLWAGNVEIHIKASDWYLHGHEKDKNYQNVILHVVWEDDVEVFSANNRLIPAFEIRKYVSCSALTNYKKLMSAKKQFINCEDSISDIDPLLRHRWSERLYFERLQHKTKKIEKELQLNNNDWDDIVFSSLIRNFGFKINADSFASIAGAIPYGIIRKVKASRQSFEALLFGMAGLLDAGLPDAYFIALRDQYAFLKNKFNLSNESVVAPSFFRLRPNNFPTIRLSQFCSLYSNEEHLFSKVIELNSIEACYKLFHAVASSYWDSHYTFGKKSALKRKKKTTRSFIELIVINTVIPVKFKYAQYTGASFDEEIISMIGALKPEDNSIITGFRQSGIDVSSAFGSQSLLHLYNNYCSKNKCLQCEIGNKLINE